jgi:hypothetical protein
MAMSAAIGVLTAALVVTSGLALGDPAATLDESTLGLTDRVARIGGVVESIADSGFGLASENGSVTVLVGPRTRFRIPGVEDAGLNDLSVGDHVIAGGQRDADGIFHALVVALVPADAAVSIAGVITAVGADSITMRTQRGTVPVLVDRDTVYFVRGVENASLEDLAAGMKALSKVVVLEDGSLLARRISAARPRPIRLRGQVTSVGARTFEVRTGDGEEVEVTVDEETDFRIPGVDSATIADLSVGDRIVARAVVKEEGLILAEYVAVVPGRPTRAAGRVVEIDGMTLVLETEDARLRVVADGETRYRIPGIPEPSFDDLAVGDTILVVGPWEADGLLRAALITVRQGQPASTIGGRVLSVGPDNLMVETRQERVRVLVEDGTQFRVRGVRDPGLEDVRPGALVRATGAWLEDGTLAARLIIAVNPGSGGDTGPGGRAGGLPGGKEPIAR